MSAPGQPARVAAAALVTGVLEKGLMLSEQGTALAGLTAPERARAQGLAAGVLRHLGRIDGVLHPHLRKTPPPAARTALRLAVTEMFVDGVPAHAAVDGAVRLVRSQPKGQHLSGLVNAVARRVSLNLDVWASTPEDALPPWIDARLRAAWGDDAARAITAAHRVPAPLDLTLRDPATAQHWAGVLGAAILPTGSLRLTEPGQVTALPGFAEGAWWVQDAAAALPARVLAPGPGEAVLDLCAAPGGKTLQLAAREARVTALDISPARLERLEDNLRRTGLTAFVVTADALAWAPDALFDAILLDAPCTASGTIRRHPDLPHLRTGRDLTPLLSLQAGLLARAWDWLTPGGHLVYATCSLLPAEGENIVASFCKTRGDVRREALEASGLGVEPHWIDASGALRIRTDYWADRGGIDGFYAALLRKEP